MGVEFDRIMDGFEGPFQPVADLMDIPAGVVRTSQEGPAGFLLSHEVNNAFSAVFTLLSQGSDVYWLTNSFSSAGTTYPEGTFWIPGGAETQTRLAPLARDLGLTFVGVTEGPKGAAMELAKPRIGLWDQYGGSSESGWVRFILDEFGMDFELVFPQELDAGNLGEKFDVLDLPGRGYPFTQAGG